MNWIIGWLCLGASSVSSKLSRLSFWLSGVFMARGDSWKARAERLLERGRPTQIKTEAHR